MQWSLHLSVSRLIHMVWKWIESSARTYGTKDPQGQNFRAFTWVYTSGSWMSGKLMQYSSYGLKSSSFVPSILILLQEKIVSCAGAALGIGHLSEAPVIQFLEF